MNRVCPYARLARMLCFSDMHGVRLLLLMAELSWAATLAWPGETFERPTYALMAAIADEDVWAAMFALTAAVQAWILCSGNYHGRRALLFAAWDTTLWWAAVTTIHFSVSPPAASISAAAALALGASWVLIRTGKAPVRHGRRVTDDRATCGSSN